VVANNCNIGISEVGFECDGAFLMKEWFGYCLLSDTFLSILYFLCFFASLFSLYFFI